MLKATIPFWIRTSLSRDDSNVQNMQLQTRLTEDLKTEKKITSLKTLIGKKIELYTSWLLVVDNVTSISRVHIHLPDCGNEQWVRGQLLITTQDSASIPLTESMREASVRMHIL